MLKRSVIQVASIALAIIGSCALANPNGPQVVSGTASFSQPNANTLNVTNSHNAIINWQGFNIGVGQTTNFIQPSRASAVMNRVLSNSPTKIYGNLNSNGQVFLINQHGLIIGAGAQINTAGFYGSTLNITNADFLNGNLKFEGGGFGGIINQGYIHAGPGGNVVLIAPDIENGGVIEVDNGQVVLAAGESIRITSLNDASIEFDVQSHDDNRIINLGDIIARQGAARLFAGNLTHSGTINATGIVQNADGSISLVARQDIEVTASAILTANGDEGGSILVQSHHGDVYFSGNASAQGDTRQGGNIQILGDRVGLFGDASVNVSGRTGGGEVLIGGAFQGQGDTQTAAQTQVSSGASIHADAIESGNGGKVIVWADDYTLFHGVVTAKGGEISGDGGFIEISGKQTLNFNGFVDASANNGLSGTVLFDPLSVTFAIGGLTTLPVNPYTFLTDPGQTTIFDPFAITGITNLGTDVVIQADRDITINNDIITAEGGGGGNITFQAGQSVFINANIFTDNGNLSITANDPGANITNRGAGVAEITMAPGTSIDAGTGNIEITMSIGPSPGTLSGDITLNSLTANHAIIRQVGATAGSDILQIAGGTITANSLFIDHDGPANGTVGTVALPLNLVVDNLGAHIHESTNAPNGIYINAQPRVSVDVTVGGTCYGTGAVGLGCDSFGPHTILGLETVNGGNINLNITSGSLIIADQIRIDDVQATGNAGNISIVSTNTIISNTNIFNNIVGGTVDFNTPNPISLTAGTYGGTFTSSGVGNPVVNGNVTFDRFNLAVTSSLTLAGGTLVFASDAAFAGDFNLTGGALDVSGITLSVTGAFNWSAGASIQGGGSGVLDLFGNTTVGGAGVHNVINIIVNNTGALTLNSLLPGDFQLESGSVFNNFGSFDLLNDSDLGTGTSATFNNTGLFSKSGGLGTSTVNSAVAFINTGAAIQVDSGTLVIASLPTLTLDAGSTLFGNGTYSGNVVNNGGTVVPGNAAAIGTLTIIGNFTNTLGNVVIDIQNGGTPVAGIDYDLLQVQGQADLGGNLVLLPVAGYTVSNNDTFVPITYLTRTMNQFAAIVGIGGGAATPTYTGNIGTTGDLSLTLTPGGGVGFFWTIIDDLIAFLENFDKLTKAIASNQPEAESVMQELLNVDGDKDSLLVCI